MTRKYFKLVEISPVEAVSNIPFIVVEPPPLPFDNKLGISITPDYVLRINEGAAAVFNLEKLIKG